MKACLRRNGGKGQVVTIPVCPCCGVRCTKHGWFSRGVKLPELDTEEPSVWEVWVKRFACKACKKTCSRPPPCLMVLKRYAALVVQGCWRGWLAGQSIATVTESWGLPSIQTVQRWIAQYRSEFRRPSD